MKNLFFLTALTLSSLSMASYGATESETSIYQESPEKTPFSNTINSSLYANHQATQELLDEYNESVLDCWAEHGKVRIAILANTPLVRCLARADAMLSLNLK